MKIIDISWPITANMTEYKDRKSVRIEPIKQFERDGVRETMLTMHNHTGTHVDAPSHFVRNGGTSETILLDALIGICRVLDLTHVTECITQKDLAEFDIRAGERILLRTKNSLKSPTDAFDPTFVYVRKDAAQMLADLKIACVGIDYLGIERNQPGHETHIILLEANVTVIEGLRLGAVVPGAHQLCCLPLNIPGIDGAPARALLISNSI